jgi:hypothetical protein
MVVPGSIPKMIRSVLKINKLDLSIQIVSVFFVTSSLFLLRNEDKKIVDSVTLYYAE